MHVQDEIEITLFSYYPLKNPWNPMSSFYYYNWKEETKDETKTECILVKMKSPNQKLSWFRILYEMMINYVINCLLPTITTST